MCRLNIGDMTDTAPPNTAPLRDYSALARPTPFPPLLKFLYDELVKCCKLWWARSVTATETLPTVWCNSITANAFPAPLYHNDRLPSVRHQLR